MLKSIRFTEKCRCFEEGFSLEFDAHLNVLVGDQGCGKSTLIQATRDNAGAESKGLKSRPQPLRGKATVVAGPCQSYAFDFEKDNLRTLSYFKDNCYGFQVGAMFKSHGETNLVMLEAMHKLTNACILLDEPDMALSVKSILKLVDSIHKTVAGGNQVVIAVHNPLLIESMGMVYSVEHREWMPGKQFLETAKLEYANASVA